MSSSSPALAGTASTAANDTSQSGSGAPGAFPELLDPVRLHVARLYGRGFSRRQIAKAMADHIVPSFAGRPLPDRIKAARRRLGEWERQQSFRDLVWDNAVLALDMSGPQILASMKNQALRGRVDAAKLALEVTGRHTSRENTQVTAVQVNIANGVPRPG